MGRHYDNFFTLFPLLVISGQQLVIVSSAPLSSSSSSIEWWGDERGTGGQGAFYELIYDEKVCSGEIIGEAVRGFVYLGDLVSVGGEQSSSDCIISCLADPACNSVNFFHSTANQKESSGGLCELMKQSTMMNPELVKPLSTATFYDNLRCVEYDPMAIYDTEDEAGNDDQQQTESMSEIEQENHNNRGQTYTLRNILNKLKLRPSKTSRHRLM